MIAAHLPSTSETIANPGPARNAERPLIDVLCASTTRLPGGDIELFLRTSEGTGRLRVPASISAKLFVITNAKPVERLPAPKPLALSAEPIAGADLVSGPDDHGTEIVVIERRGGSRMSEERRAQYERVVARVHGGETWRAAAKAEGASVTAASQWHYGRMKIMRALADAGKQPITKPSGQIL